MPSVETASAVAAAAAMRPPRSAGPGGPEAEDHERRPGRRLHVDVQIQGREHEAAQRVDDAPGHGRDRRKAQAAGQEHERGGGQGDVEGEQR